MARLLEAENRTATDSERDVLARWSSWGAIPQVFDESNQDWNTQREELRELFSDEQWDAAKRTTINAHYTDPAYAQAIWKALGDLGFEHGRALEPGAGSGTFIGLAPEDVDMVGVELDPVTASIARGLYPHAEVRTESFAETRFPDGYFDAAVGNVPFANVTLHDAAHNGSGHSMHNHFIVKSLALTRPGGVVGVLTSSFTMDAVDSSARREMNSMADLVGAVRLPTGAHRRTAGTDAVTDLLIFRKRMPGEPKRDVSWENVTALGIGNTAQRINTYFHTHPENVLGTLAVGHGMYGSETLLVESNDLQSVASALPDRLEDIVAEAKQQGLTMEPVDLATQIQRSEVLAPSEHLWDGSILVGALPEEFTQVKNGLLQPFAVPKTRQRELSALLVLRDKARDVMELEATTAEDTPDLTERRTDLLATWEGYVDTYGPINRFSLRNTGRYEKVLDDLTGEPLVGEDGELLRGDQILARQTPPVMRLLRDEPFFPLIQSLERFDEETQHVNPASLLTERLLVPREAATSAETPAEALAISLDETGKVDIDRIGELLDADPADGRYGLGDLVYDDPVTGELINAPDYLSGNVREKLEAAQQAAETDDKYAVNVTSLEEVQPEPVAPADIKARLGAVWISPDDHQQFLRETLEDSYATVESPLPGEWKVTGGRNGVKAVSEWGTDRRPAGDILESAMNQSPIHVRDTVDLGDGKTQRILNPVETDAAQAKAEALQERFEEWVWEEPQRATRLADEYNRRFNSIRLQDYSQAGDYLTFPGMAETFTMRPHQRAAVARMVAEPTTGLFHQVGAGKTLEMIGGATELRRMGLVRKPAVIVPNHMLEQFTREWLQAYPQANILAASSKDLTGDRRRTFVARTATNDWDGIIMTQEAFKKIAISSEYQAKYIEGEIEVLQQGLERAQEAGSSTVKQIEKKILTAEEKHKQQLAIPRDAGLMFEDTGIDYLLVDEAHMYKNLSTVSSIPDANIRGSQQANDLNMKLSYLREMYGPRVATMATATPIANSVTEAHVMQRYLRPDLLQAAGVEHFDAWAATFGQQVTAIESSVTGGFKVKTRFAKFQNVPELLRMWHVFADVKTASDLDLPIPQIAQRPSDGQRQVENVILEPTDELVTYMESLADRSDAVAGREVDPTEDNMLKITGDGRKAALDLRLVDPNAAPQGPVKLDAVADRILTHWYANRDREYVGTDGEISPLRGSMQMVFSDLGTPSDTRWNVYDDLKQKLVAGGMPAGAIRFIHETKNDVEKGRLFAAGRSGHIAVLVGSTAKMGMGTNVQDRISAMHHIDCPWRPADIEQRDGRALRQGNQNSEVEMFRYLVERSFDTYNWQTIARKAEFIAQIMTGRIDVREIEDIGDTAMSANEAKALGSGNPLLLEKAQADSELQTLRRQETAHSRAQHALRNTVRRAQGDIENLHGEIAALEQSSSRSVDTSGDRFALSVSGQPYTARTDAAQAAVAYLIDYQRYPGPPTRLGTIGGHTIEAQTKYDQFAGMAQNVVTFRLEGVPRSEHRVAFNEAARGDGIGLIRQLENKVAAIPKNLAAAKSDLESAQRTLTHAEENIGRPFTRQGELDAAYEKVAQLNDELEAQAQPKQEPETPAQGETVQPDATREQQAPISTAARIHAASFPAPPTVSKPNREANGHQQRSRFQRVRGRTDLER